jgi:hypothetical protein
MYLFYFCVKIIVLGEEPIQHETHIQMKKFKFEIENITISTIINEN